MNELTMLCFV